MTQQQRIEAFYNDLQNMKNAAEVTYQSNPYAYNEGKFEMISRVIGVANKHQILSPDAGQSTDKK